jgi:chaperone required for assembly of F1-ATPase
MLEKDPPDLCHGQSFPQPDAAADPIAMARREFNKALPRRFYKESVVQGRKRSFALPLDSRAAKTPGGNDLALPTLAGARALANEWAAVGEIIDPALMPLTRLVNSAIDGVPACHNSGGDCQVCRVGPRLLPCWRAASPRARASRRLGPILAFAQKKLGAAFICTQGVVYIDQPEAACLAVEEAVARIADGGRAAPFALAALSVMTTLSGSVLIALAVAHGEVTLTEAWRAAHVDEDFEMRAWGEDAYMSPPRAEMARDGGGGGAVSADP